MSQQQYIREPRYSQKYQQYIAVACVILLFELPFFTTIGVTLYALITLNSKIIAIEGLIIIISLPIRRSELYINLVRKYIVPTTYFKDFYRIFDQKIEDGVKPLFCFHPHSIFAYCIFYLYLGIVANMNCGNDKMTQMVGLVSRFIFNVPITGIIFRLFGLDSVDPDNFVHLMKQGKTIGILPGGFQQATLTTPQEMRIYIKNRYGFIKYALKYGYTIYPTITLNQHKQFKTFDYLLELRLFVNKFKFPGVLFFSNWLLFMNPNFQMITVVGKGIKPQKQFCNQSPTKQQIQGVQQKYIKEIQRLYKKYQHLNGGSPLAIY